jgi:hypothetical protein
VTVTAGLVVTFNEVVYVGPAESGFQAPDLALTVLSSAEEPPGVVEVEFRVEDPQGTSLAGYLTWVRGGEDDVVVLGRYTEGTYLGYRGLRFQPLAP